MQVGNLTLGLDEYAGPWYGQADDAQGDIPGPSVFAGLKSVFATDETIKDETEP